MENKWRLAVKNTNLPHYHAERLKAVEDMTPDELPGMPIEIMYLLDEDERKMAEDLVKKFTE